MTLNTVVSLRPPYVVFIGDCNDPLYAKTGFGLVDWCAEKVIGQCKFEGNYLNLGVDSICLEEAKERGANSLVIGVAPIGGKVNESWLSTLSNAAYIGMDIVSGLHTKLEGFSEVRLAAERSGSRLVNVRTPPENLPIGSGTKRKGKRVLMVGTDCAVGKKYTALSITKEMKEKNLDVDFRATGQTGIMIAGQGIPIDAVISDYIAGAAEVISPNNNDDHWDIIEGQGSLFNPSYAGVSLGLMHGSQPDAIVVCHDATRKTIASSVDYPTPDIKVCIEHNLVSARLTNLNVKCVGVSVNTSGLPEKYRNDYLANLSNELDLPCVDPMQTGCSAIIENLINTVI